jgi:H+/Cl- antiporter ClcA
MPHHAPFATWLAAGAVLLTIVVLHAVIVLKLASSRSNERARVVKPRTYWLLLLSFANPLMPLTALIVLLLVYKSFIDGQESEDSTEPVN